LSADGESPGTVDASGGLIEERCVCGAAEGGASLQPSSVSASNSSTVAGGNWEMRPVEGGGTELGGDERGLAEGRTLTGGASLQPSSVSASNSSTVAGGNWEMRPVEAG
jgi:hypothetical protein